MKLLKLALISFVLFFILLVIISSLIPSDVRISRAVNISATPAQVMQHTGSLENWRKWNLMIQDTVLTNPSYSDNQITSEEVYIKLDSLANDFVRTSWKRHARTVESNIRLINSADGVTIVQWYFDIHLRWYPWEKFSSIVFDKQMGPLMEQSLDRLRDLSESTNNQP